MGNSKSSKLTLPLKKTSTDYASLNPNYSNNANGESSHKLLAGQIKNFQKFELDDSEINASPFVTILQKWNLWFSEQWDAQAEDEEADSNVLEKSNSMMEDKMPNITQKQQAKQSVQLFTTKIHGQRSKIGQIAEVTEQIFEAIRVCQETLSAFRLEDMNLSSVDQMSADLISLFAAVKEFTNEPMLIDAIYPLKEIVRFLKKFNKGVDSLKSKIIAQKGKFNIENLRKSLTMIEENFTQQTNLFSNMFQVFKNLSKKTSHSVLLYFINSLDSFNENSILMLTKLMRDQSESEIKSELFSQMNILKEISALLSNIEQFLNEIASTHQEKGKYEEAKKRLSYARDTFIKYQNSFSASNAKILSYLEEKGDDAFNIVKFHEIIHSHELKEKLLKYIEECNEFVRSLDFTSEKKIIMPQPTIEVQENKIEENENLEEEKNRDVQEYFSIKLEEANASLRSKKHEVNAMIGLSKRDEIEFLYELNRMLDELLKP